MIVTSAPLPSCKIAHRSKIVIDDILLYSTNMYTLLRYSYVQLESLSIIAYLLSLVSVSSSVFVSNIWGTILRHKGTAQRSRNLICLRIRHYLIMALLSQLSLDYMHSIRDSLLGSKSILNYSAPSNDVTTRKLFYKWNGHPILLNYSTNARKVSPPPQFSHDTTVINLSS